MKVNILFDNPKEIRSGYLNIDPFCSENDNKLVRRDDIKNLTCVDDAECEEIQAIDVLDYFSGQDTLKMLESWVKKLSHNSLFVIQFTDMYLLNKAILSRNLTLEEANELMHGKQTKGWLTRRSTLSAEYMSRLLEKLGLKITLKRINGIKVIIKARRV
jgi:hypothetical protein